MRFNLNHSVLKIVIIKIFLSIIFFAKHTRSKDIAVSSEKSTRLISK